MKRSPLTTTCLDSQNWRCTVQEYATATATAAAAAAAVAISEYTMNLFFVFHLKNGEKCFDFTPLMFENWEKRLQKH